MVFLQKWISIAGFLSNHIDIAPNYAGTLMAITNTAATLPGIIMPIFVGAITHGNVSRIALNLLLLWNEIKWFGFHWTANDKRVASYFLCDSCIVHHWNYCVHIVRFWRWATMEQITSSWTPFDNHSQTVYRKYTTKRARQPTWIDEPDQHMFLDQISFI